MVATSNKRYKAVPIQNSWIDQQPRFGTIKGLHLKMLEFEEKIKKDAQLIPDPMYTGDAFRSESEDTEIVTPHSPDFGPSPLIVDEASSEIFQEELHTGDVTRSSDDDTQEMDLEEMAFADQFGQSADSSSLKLAEKEATSKPTSSKYVRLPTEPLKPAPPPPKKEKTDEEKYIEEEVERRTLINALRKMKQSGLILEDIDSDMSLTQAQMLMTIAKQEQSEQRSISINKCALVAGFFGIDKAAGLFTDTMEGYLQFQEDIMHVYDPLLEEIGETDVTVAMQNIDPSLKLVGAIVASSVAFYASKNTGIDQRQATNLIQVLFPKSKGMIAAMTNASERLKKEDASEESVKPKRKKKRRRGPSFKPDDIDQL